MKFKIERYQPYGRIACRDPWLHEDRPVSDTHGFRYGVFERKGFGPFKWWSPVKTFASLSVAEEYIRTGDHDFPKFYEVAR